jgi:hypothetical protein
MDGLRKEKPSGSAQRITSKTFKIGFISPCKTKTFFQHPTLAILQTLLKPQKQAFGTFLSDNHFYLAHIHLEDFLEF